VSTLGCCEKETGVDRVTASATLPLGQDQYSRPRARCQVGRMSCHDNVTSELDKVTLPCYTGVVMTAQQIFSLIENAKVDWKVSDLKACIFADDLRDTEIMEVIAEHTFHGYSLIRDALNRTGHSTDDLRVDADKLASQFPDSYAGDDYEWAIWDSADYYVMEVLARDSRICKRAGW